MIEILEAMTYHLLLAKIPWVRLQKLKKKFKRVDYLALLKDIYYHEYREVIEIWNLIPEEQWTAYENMEIFGLREQLLLKQAQQNLKLAFTEKVLSHGKKKKAGEETTPTDSE